MTHSPRATVPKLLLLLSKDELLISASPAVIPDEPSASELVPPPHLPTVLLSADSASPSELFQLSLDALSGSPSPRTLRLRGSVCSFPVTILVDSGSSHNIIQPRIAHHLRLALQPLAPFDVLVGNGDALCCSGFCLSVSLVLQGHSFTVPLYVIPIHGADLVLGVPWLQSFGPFLSDFSVPSMHFCHQNTLVTFTGASSLSVELVSFHQLCHMVATDAVASAFTISVQQPEFAPFADDDLTHLAGWTSFLFCRSLPMFSPVLPPFCHHVPMTITSIYNL
ncbi:hypothetical protein Sango_2316400 [Sesamum angolense]|uniref:Uncharacterized protein n=1 Tax=Sesamum angolense TaxID=2727404 RepID=A0AAE2BLI6_9LAMI|nr:hypothetical protein Sango_2316400 [Sesamum angolense]